MEINYENLAAGSGWSDYWKYSPAARHRRRLIEKSLRPIRFESLLDVGCGRGELLKELSGEFKAKLAGCDISGAAIEANSQQYTGLRFWELDLQNQSLLEKFDLVVCTEVLEHIPNWEKALGHLMEMSKHYLLLTIPTPPMFPTDRAVGHLQHFKGDELIRVLADSGFRIKSFIRWGFPFHSLYKWLINSFSSNYIQKVFMDKKYGFFQRTISYLLYRLFYLNTGKKGYQLLILAERE